MTEADVLKAREDFKVFTPYYMHVPDNYADDEYWEYYFDSVDKHFNIRSVWNDFLVLYQKEFLEKGKEFRSEFYEKSKDIALHIMSYDSFWEHTTFNTKIPDCFKDKCMVMEKIKTGRKYLSIDANAGLWQKFETYGIIKDMHQYIYDFTGSELFAGSKNFRYAIGNNIYNKALSYDYINFMEKVYNSDDALIIFLKKNSVPFYCLDVDDLLWDITDCTGDVINVLQTFVTPFRVINGVKVKINMYQKEYFEFSNGIKCYTKHYSDDTYKIYAPRKYNNDALLFHNNFIQILKMCSGEVPTNRDLKYWNTNIKLKKQV